MPLLKYDFSNGRYSGLAFRWAFSEHAEESNPRKYICRQEVMESYVQSFINQCLIKSNDKIGLNLKFERAFVLVLKSTLGSSAVTHYNKNTTTNYQLYTQRCPDGVECLVIVVVRGFELWMDQ